MYNVQSSPSPPPPRPRTQEPASFRISSMKRTKLDDQLEDDNLPFSESTAVLGITLHHDHSNSPTSGVYKSMLHFLQESCRLGREYNEAKISILTISPNVVIQAWKKYLAPWLAVVFRSYLYAVHMA